MKSKPLGVPDDVKAIRSAISEFFKLRTSDGFAIGSYFGVYVFFDYDGEPVYVGQSLESIGQRVGRHLTNQRTDAVAMNVLDPFEVAAIEVFPLCHRAKNPPPREELARQLNALEYTVFQKVLAESSLKAVLNEKDLSVTDLVEIPPSFKATIIPEDLYQKRKHPDVRIARRASTIARLAQVISERDVSMGLRRTMVTQARRLEKLASERFGEMVSAGEEVPSASGDPVDQA